MSQINFKDIEAMNEIATSLTPENVQQLQTILKVQSAIVEKTGTEPLVFLDTLRYDFPQFDSIKFLDALGSIGRHDLIPFGQKLSWVTASSAKGSQGKEASPSFETFVQLLRNEVESNQWRLIVATGMSERVTTELDFETAFQISVEKELILPDLGQLCNVIKAVARNDLIEKIQNHASVFKEMDKTEFQTRLLEELETDDKEEQVKWSNALRAYVKQRNKKVSVLLDDGENVLLEYVYTPLTVVREELANLKVGEDTTLNEIAFLKSMSDNIKRLETVDFIPLVSSLDSNEPEVLILIGNPGSGKTFLCKYLALLYGTYELNNFTYVLSVPCRNEEWHKMEKTRQENEIEIEEEFVQKWLSLAMPMGTRWSKSLAKHFTKTGGEGLLLIIDGVDEFIKDVPFKTTLLYFLLQKRILNCATVLVTSRPGAWNEIREEHGQELRVDSNFQVLGFSPEDRDSYFEKRITTEAKLKDTKELFFRHDEINQLSLVPVNASLFTSLFNATNNILSQTLTHLYSALILYIVRRQLSRMGLKKFTRVERVAQFHPSVMECMNCIGEEAYEGIFHRELSCREVDIAIRVDSSEYKTERLGLMQVQVELLKLGHRVNVWTFAHLTLQEYMASVYLSNKTWVTQCVMIRFIVSSEEVFAMYKMVVRFLCGLLSDRAACIIPIICRNIIPDTFSLLDFPMIHQLGYYLNIFDVSDWFQFTQVYLLISTLIVETNSKLMKLFFICFLNLLPEHLYFHFCYPISPNEWHCFLLSLTYICKVEILDIQINLINPKQFGSLLHQLSFCSLSYLAIAFFGHEPEPIQSYTSLISSTDIPINYKISLCLRDCVLTESQPSSHLFPTTNNNWTGSIMLYESKISNEILTNLINHFSCIENIYYAPKSDSDWSVLLSLIPNKSQIKGLYIRDINSYLPETTDILSVLSSLEEVLWYKEDAYTALPQLQTNSSLSFLTLSSPKYDPPLSENYKQQLINVISNNRTSLRDIELDRLHTVGLNSWTRILTPIQSCCNLVSLKLTYSPFPSDDISYWDTAIPYLQSLVELALLAIPLRDTGLMSLCKSLNRHPTIRNLRIRKCELTSDSCEPIMMLIHTLPYLRLLKLYVPELSLPDANPLQLLQQTAELFSVKV